MTLDGLRELAERATPGPWRSIRCETPGYRHMAFSRKRYEPYTIGPALPADTAYLAACSPEVIKALVAVAEAASRQMEESPDWSKPHLLIALDALKAVLA